MSGAGRPSSRLNSSRSSGARMSVGRLPSSGDAASRASWPACDLRRQATARSGRSGHRHRRNAHEPPGRASTGSRPRRRASLPPCLSCARSDAGNVVMVAGPGWSPVGARLDAMAWRTGPAPARPRTHSASRMRAGNHPWEGNVRVRHAHRPRARPDGEGVACGCWRRRRSERPSWRSPSETAGGRPVASVPISASTTNRATARSSLALASHRAVSRSRCRARQRVGTRLCFAARRPMAPARRVPSRHPSTRPRLVRGGGWRSPGQRWWRGR